MAKRKWVFATIRNQYKNRQKKRDEEIKQFTVEKGEIKRRVRLAKSMEEGGPTLDQLFDALVSSADQVLVTAGQLTEAEDNFAAALAVLAEARNNNQALEGPADDVLTTNSALLVAQTNYNTALSNFRSARQALFDRLLQILP